MFVNRLTYFIAELDKLCIDHIVRLLGVHVIIVSDRVPDSHPSFRRLLGKPWVLIYNGMLTSILRQMDRFEKTIQMLEDKLSVTVMQFDENSDCHLFLIEFSHNNSSHTTLGTSVCWNEVEEWIMLGPKLVDDATEKLNVLKRNMKVTQDRQKSTADVYTRNQDFQCWGSCIHEIYHHKKR